MKRLLLLLPTRGYRARAFVEAALRLGVAMTVASEEPSTMESFVPGGLLTLDFSNPERASAQSLEFARHYPIDAIVGVDDSTAALHARISQAMGLPANPPPAVAAARNKRATRETLQRAGLPGPEFQVLSVESDPGPASLSVPYPCVLKPTVLSASRGVIRADDPADFTAAFQRIVAILAEPENRSLGPAAREILVEAFVPGREFALEGLLRNGVLAPLALFDKPDPLDGPYFEETLYVTPARLTPEQQRAVIAAVEEAVHALGLQQGPVHAEVRLSPGGPVVLEVNPRSIGGECSRMLRFGAGMALEEIIMRQALGMEIPSLEREREAAGAMMLPIARGGVLREIRGQNRARAVDGITDLVITTPPGSRIRPLPEGGAYLGFLFARGGSPDGVEAALRRAWAELQVVVE